MMLLFVEVATCAGRAMQLGVLVEKLPKSIEGRVGVTPDVPSVSGSCSGDHVSQFVELC